MSIQAGIHHARAIDGAFGVAKTGTKQIAVTFEITEGDHAGARVVWYGYFTDRALDRTLAALRACGCTFPANDVTNLDGLTRSVVALKCREEPDADGFPVVRVAFVDPVRSEGAGLSQPMDDASKRSLAAELRGRLAANGTQAAPAARRAPTPTLPSVSRPSFGRGAPPATQRRAVSVDDDDLAY